MDSLALENLARVLGRLPTPPELERFAALVNLARLVPHGDMKILGEFGQKAYWTFAPSCKSQNDVVDIAEEALLEAWHQLNPLPDNYVKQLFAGVSQANSQVLAAKKNSGQKSSQQPLSPAHKKDYEDILNALEKQGKTHAQLSRDLNISPATLTRRIKELKAAGKVVTDPKFGGYYRPDCPPKIDL